MKVLVGALVAVLATPVYAVDFFSQEGSSKRSPKKPSLEQRVQLLERRINTISSMVLRLDSLQQEMQQLRGDVEIQNHAMERMKQRQTDFYTDMDQRISRLSGETPANQPMQPGAVSLPTKTVVKDTTQPKMAPPSTEPSWQSTPITPGKAQPPAAAKSPTPARAGRVQVQPSASSLPPVVSSKTTSSKSMFLRISIR